MIFLLKNDTGTDGSCILLLWVAWWAVTTVRVWAAVGAWAAAVGAARIWRWNIDRARLLVVRDRATTSRFSILSIHFAICLIRIPMITRCYASKKEQKINDRTEMEKCPWKLSVSLFYLHIMRVGQWQNCSEYSDVKVYQSLRRRSD